MSFPGQVKSDSGGQAGYYFLCSNHKKETPRVIEAGNFQGPSEEVFGIFSSSLFSAIW